VRVGPEDYTELRLKTDDKDLHYVRTKCSPNILREVIGHASTNGWTNLTESLLCQACQMHLCAVYFIALSHGRGFDSSLTGVKVFPIAWKIVGIEGC
jgi:hypothetical protein